ncbi:hypothetical protein STEG23_025114 [Scotinomys teguina]
MESCCGLHRIGPPCHLQTHINTTDGCATGRLSRAFKPWYGQRPTLKLTINGVGIIGLLDTGADRSIIAKKIGLVVGLCKLRLRLFKGWDMLKPQISMQLSFHGRMKKDTPVSCNHSCYVVNAVKCLECAGPIKPSREAKMGRHQCKSGYNIIKNKITPESSPPPTPKSDYCNADKAEENDLKKSLMKMLEEAFEEKMKNVSKEIGENTNKKLEEINKEIEEKKSKKLEEMNNEIEEKKNKKLEEMNNEIEEKKNKRV